MRAVIMPQLSRPLLARNSLFSVCGFFNDAVPSSGFISSNGRLISDLINGLQGVWSEAVVA